LFANDPISDPSGEVIHLRDNDAGPCGPRSRPRAATAERALIIVTRQADSLSARDSRAVQDLVTSVDPSDPVKTSLSRSRTLVRRAASASSARRVVAGPPIEWAAASS
jgi:hypothetical protein